MKKLTIFETGIIGFLSGIVIAAYVTFLAGTDGFFGYIVSWVSLRPVLDLVSVDFARTLLATFLFTVGVYTVYGIIFGLIFQKNTKIGIAAVCLTALLAIGGVFEQVRGAATHVAQDTVPVYTAAVVDSRPKVAPTPQQYFGNEVKGDLNGDGKDDVAFLIVRNDPDRGILYYLVSALTFDGGKAGTNLIFVGEKMNPLRISIENGVIGLEYMTLSNKNSTSTSMLYAKVVDGVLEKIEKTEKVASVPVVTEAASSTEVTQ